MKGYHAGEQKRGGCMIGKCTHPNDCTQCGFWADEAERRKSIELTECQDGLMRKLLHRKKNEDPEYGEGET